MSSSFRIAGVAAAALIAALAFSSGDAFAKKPIGSTIKNGVNAIDNITKGLGKGGRAVDDLIEGGVRGADDLAEGVGRNADDVLQGIGRSLDDIGESGARNLDDAAGIAAKNRPPPPITGDVADVPKYTAAPLKQQPPKSNIYDVIDESQLLTDDALKQGENAAGYVMLEKKAAGYLQPDDAMEPGILDEFGAPAGYTKPGAPAGAPAKPDLPGAKPIKPDKGGKAKLPDIGGKTKVAKITPLSKAGDDVAGQGVKGVHIVRVPAANLADPKVTAAAARKASKALKRKVLKIKIAGGTAGLLVAGATTTVILYYTVEPVREAFDGAGEKVNDGFGEVSDFFTPDVKLTVDNQADGPVEIFKNDANGNLESIGSINETPGSTTLDVQQGDTITVFLSGEQFGDPVKVEEEQTITVVN